MAHCILTSDEELVLTRFREAVAMGNSRLYVTIEGGLITLCDTTRRDTPKALAIRRAGIDARVRG